MISGLLVSMPMRMIAASAAFGSVRSKETRKSKTRTMIPQQKTFQSCVFAPTVCASADRLRELAAG